MNDLKNNLLKRREVSTVIENKSNPGYESTLNDLAKNLKVDKNLLVIKSLKSKFGNNSFLVNAFVYDTIQDKERIEPKKKEKKSKVEEAKK
ncbi:hypothetical protein HYW75_04535 [Candidatus Pacearchaeota archaeon]|nr:hypothetical protein [Candidatus Pacearchaeota archaeon]